jgi:hypothetical protein
MQEVVTSMKAEELAAELNHTGAQQLLHHGENPTCPLNAATFSPGGSIPLMLTLA